MDNQKDSQEQKNNKQSKAADKPYRVIARQMNKEMRFIVIDTKSGKLLDDAQGYGYKSYAAAKKGYWYKCKSTEEKDKFRERKLQAYKWWKAHKNIANEYEIFLFDALKDHTEPTAKECKTYIQNMLDRDGIVLDNGLTIDLLYKNS